MRKDWVEFTIEELKRDSLIGLVRSSDDQNSNSVGVSYLKMNNIDLIGNVQLSGLVYVKANDIEIEKYSLEFGDILINTRNSYELVGKSGVVRKPPCKVLFNNNIMRLRIREGFDNFFVAYQLISPFVRKQMEKHKKATTSVCALYQGNIFSLKLIIPPLPEQRAIVSKIEELFSELDNAIDNLKSAQAKLEIFRQAVLKKAFEGGFSQEFNQQNDGDFSLGWSWKSIKEISTVLGDGLHGTPKYSQNGEYYFINGNNLTDRKIQIKPNTKQVEKDEFEKYKKPLTQRTIFVSINGTLGNTAFYNNEKVILGKSACYFNLVESVSKEYILYVLKTNKFLNYIHTEATGSTIKNVSLKSMREFLIPLPSSLIEQNQIVQEIESRLSVADKLAETIQTNLLKSESLRQSVLKKAFEGKLLTESELDACRKEADWEPAERLLERIKNGNKIKTKS